MRITHLRKEDKQFNNVPSVSWRAMKASDEIQSHFKCLKTMQADDVCLSPGSKRQEMR